MDDFRLIYSHDSKVTIDVNRICIHSEFYVMCLGSFFCGVQFSYEWWK